MRVGPKAMQARVRLAESPGVVNKDQLLSSVWPDVCVSYHVLPGCVSARLSDGIAEGVINDLSEIPALKVMAWTTVSRYRDRQADVRTLGRQLGVKSVLTGRLFRQADRIVIQTELVDVNRGSQLWGQQ